MESEDFDFNRVCRSCKNEATDMRLIFNKDGESEAESPRLDEMLMACASIQVTLADNLPKSICETCIGQLKTAFRFKQRCEKNDVIFRGLAKSMKGAAIKQEEGPIGDPDFASHLLGELHSALNQINKDKQSDGVKNEHDVSEDQQDPTERCDFIELLDNNVMLLICRTCAKVFTTLDGLKCHKRIHSGALFKCTQCDKEYTRMNHLQRHELSHGRRKVHVCKICNKTLTRFEHLKRHLITHLKEKPFGCPTCNRGFNRAEHLANHVKRCKGERVHICDICNKGFNREDSLEVHKRLHENKLPALPTLENLDNIEEHYVQIDFDNKITFSDTSDVEELDDIDINDRQEDGADDDCENKEESITVMPELNSDIYAEEDPREIMEEKAKIEEELYKDVDDVQNYDDNVGNDSDSVHSEYLPTKPMLKLKRGRGRPRKHPVGLKSVKLSSGRPRGRPPSIKIKIEPDEEELGVYTCPQCNEVFPKMSLLEKHAQSHEGLKLHECETCNKKFTRANHLKRHKLSHSEIKPFICAICTKCFTRRDHLQQHMKLHSRTQEFPCEICKRVFNRAEHLAKHMAAKHSIGEKIIGEKKYKCHVCSKGFTTEKYRDVHMKAHTGDKRFQCKTCEKTFLSKSHLTEHIKFHNDNSKKFLCSECGQRFIRNDYLVIHMRRHRGEKPFKCKFCGKGFPRTTDLTVHERYHTGEKTHLCVICGRGFGRAYNLTVHMRTHTGEKPYRCTYCDAAFAQGNDLKAHVRRHTGERFQCELCPDTFLMGYLLTQHKRVVHGLNVVSNIRRLQPVNKMKPLDPDEPPPITVTLPQPVIPQSCIQSQLQISQNLTQE